MRLEADDQTVTVHFDDDARWLFSFKFNDANELKLHYESHNAPPRPPHVVEQKLQIAESFLRGKGYKIARRTVGATV